MTCTRREVSALGAADVVFTGTAEDVVVDGPDRRMFASAEESPSK
jgi:hypothetical protein